jgi:predicted kinase
MKECVVLVGLPGSGKSTFYRRRFSTTHDHISKDLWPNVRNKPAHQERLLNERLSAGTSVVVDNTNPTVKDRAPIIAAARKHGAKVIGYFFDVSIGEAIAQNMQREGKARVPRVAIHTIARRLEPPTLAEGFDELYRVRLLGELDFAVEKA